MNEFFKIGNVWLGGILILLTLPTCSSNSELENLNSSLISLDENSFDQLNNLLEDRKVVGIGEVTHGDGNLFELKTKLIKHLHQNLGFQAVLMESDFLAVGQTIERSTDKSLQEAASVGVLETWSKSKQFLTLIEYIKQSAEEGDTLFFEGIDPQMTGTNSLDIHLDYVSTLEGISLYERKKLQEAIAVISQINRQGYDSKQLSDLYQVISQISKKFDSRKTNSKTNQWLSNIYSSLRSLYYRSLAPPVTPNNIPEVFSHPYNLKAGAVRDSMMASNVLYYLNKYDKVIIWAANNHLILKTHTNKEHRRWMGEILKENIGSDYYAILALYYEGNWSLPENNQNGVIPKAQKGTLAEFIAKSEKCVHCFLPIEESQSSEKIVLRTNNWSVTDSIVIKEYADALLFMREVIGSIMVDTATNKN